MGFLDFAKYLFNDIPIDYQGPENGWHIVPNYSQFTYSSVAGDFRLYPLGQLVAAAWGDFVSVRDGAGRQIWRRDHTGRAVAVSPDGQQLLSFSNQRGELERLSARTGELLETFALPLAGDYANQLLWLPDGRILLLNYSALAVLGADRHQYLAYYETFAPMPEHGISLQAMSWHPIRPDEVLLSDNNGCRIMRVALSTGQVLQQETHNWPNLNPGPLGHQTLVYLHHEYLRFDPATLAVTQRVAFQGLEGVRTEAENQHQNSCTLWEKRAHISPGNKYLLAIDNSGLTWLFDAKSGYQLRIFRRELVDYAYDVLWLDDRFFLALCNRGHVVKIDITQKDGVFDVLDFTPEDDERHLPQGDTMRTEATSPDDLRAALATLATTPDLAEYAAAWEKIHFAPVDFDWARTLTANHLAGVLRQYTWYLPTAGFHRLAVFADMRQQLTALQYHLPDAPVAPALTLHDDLFTRHTYQTLETEHSSQEIEWQLIEAYQEIGNWLQLHEPYLEEEPFLETTHYTAFAEALAATIDFISTLQSGYHWEANNVLERAFPHLAADYERLVTAHTPAAQRQMLRPAQYNDEPSAVALLQRLAQQSPHAEVRAFAATSLADAGR